MGVFKLLLTKMFILFIMFLREMKLLVVIYLMGILCDFCVGFVPGIQCVLLFTLYNTIDGLVLLLLLQYIMPVLLVSS